MQHFTRQLPRLDNEGKDVSVLRIAARTHSQWTSSCPRLRTIPDRVGRTPVPICCLFTNKYDRGLRIA